MEKQTVEDVESRLGVTYGNEARMHEAEKPEDLLEWGRKEYGLDPPAGAKEKISNCSARLEDRLSKIVLETENPKDILNFFERTYMSMVRLVSKEKAEDYQNMKMTVKVNSVLNRRLNVIQTERQSLDTLIQETAESIRDLKKERNEQLRQGIMGDRVRSTAYSTYKSDESEIINLFEDLEQAESLASQGKDMTSIIHAIESEIDRKKQNMESNEDLILEAQGRQKIALERYELVSSKINEQEFIKGELRKYSASLQGIQRQLELHLANDSNAHYTKPLARIKSAREVYDNSVKLVNALVKNSYISKDLLSEFPAEKLPETKTFQMSNAPYSTRLQYDSANDKGIQINKQMRDLRRAEIRSTYDIR